VPITFLPDRFHGAKPPVPDLPQGSCCPYTVHQKRVSAKQIRIASGGADRFEAVIRGPENSFRAGSPAMEIPLAIHIDRAARRARVRVDGTALDLVPGTLSPWVTLQFRALPGIEVRGVCRMLVTELDEHFSLYVSPINIDPEKPAMPVSHPEYYASYMAKKIGTFATLGLAEDTWALNEGVKTRRRFAQGGHRPGPPRCLAASTLRRGCLWRLDATDASSICSGATGFGHPALRGAEPNGHAGTIERLYQRNDELVGRVLDRLSDGMSSWCSRITASRRSGAANGNGLAGTATAPAGERRRSGKGWDGRGPAPTPWGSPGCT
jgi:hypothetical protein